MATSSNEIERIVRKVLDEEQGETLEAIRELSTLLSEEVIPHLSKGDEDAQEPDETAPDDDEDTSMSTTGLDDVPRIGRSAKPNGSGGHDEDQEAERPDQDVPTPVMDAFTALYNS